MKSRQRKASGLIRLASLGVRGTLNLGDGIALREAQLLETVVKSDHRCERVASGEAAASSQFSQMQKRRSIAPMRLSDLTVIRRESIMSDEGPSRRYPSE